VDQVADPASGQVQKASSGRVQALLQALRAAFGEAGHLQATKASETFFEFRRGRLAIPDWSVQWELNLEEAVGRSGLEINQSALSPRTTCTSKLLAFLKRWRVT